MTTKTTSYQPANLQEIIASASPRTTVFSDGSTYHPVEGYKSNGTPARTRDSEPAKIVKTHEIATAGNILATFLTLVVLATLSILVLTGFVGHYNSENKAALTEGINEDKVVSVVKIDSENVFLRDTNGNHYRCDISTIVDGGQPTALVFCAPGPAMFSIPVPHNPNVFTAIADSFSGAEKK